MQMGIKRYTHVQSSPSTVWTISHNLNTKPAFDVMITIDGSLKKVYPAVARHVDDNTLELTFSSARTGEVRFIG